jgi:hypothetical protein
MWVHKLPEKLGKWHSFAVPFTQFFVFFLLAIFLAGCKPISLVTLTDPETSQAHSSAVVASASPGQALGQTFTSRRPRLNSLTLWVDPSKEDGELLVELFRTPTDEKPLFIQAIPFQKFRNGVLNIHIPPSLSSFEGEQGGTQQSRVQGMRGVSQPFYILLRPIRGDIQVRGRAEDIYPDGQAYTDQAPLQADIAFTTTYDYDLSALLADLHLSLPRLWLVLPLLVILFLPGWLLLEFSGLRPNFDAGERIGMAVGLSLAIIPLAMLWSSTLGLHWGRTGLLITAALLLAVALWRITRQVIRLHSDMNSSVKWEDEGGAPPSSSHFATKSPLILTGIFLLTLGVRLVMTRDLAAPAWVDSVHHATITRLILEQGGFPSTYAPYIDIDATQYHAGFHSSLAAFQWLSGLDAPEAMLLFGQVLNALIVFAMYLLAVTLTRQRTAGLAAAAIAGLFTPMPAYYTSWGRYTQLAGVLILPVGLALARQVIESGRRSVKYYVSTLVIAAIACGGLFLVHYRVAGFLALLLLSYFLSQVRFDRLANLHLIKRVALFIAAAGLLALLLTFPWSWRAITQVFAPKAAFISGSSAQAFEDFYWGYLTTAWGLPAMILAGLGLLVSLFRRPSLAFAMAVWTGSLLLVANLSALHLPGGWFVNTISVAIILFIPTAILAGYALAQFYSFCLALISPPGKAIFQWACAALGLAVALLAARALLPILRPSTNLFRSADRPAMQWIAEHIPADETILINPMYWGYGTYAGADGGFWITPLTGRKTIPPPVLYALGDPAEKQRIRTICSTVLADESDPAGLANYLQSVGVRFIYLGVLGGVLSPQALLESDRFEVLYENEGAWVFVVK